MLGHEVKLHPSRHVASKFGGEDFVQGGGLVRREAVKHHPDSHAGGALNLGGSAEPVVNAGGIVEAAVEKGAAVVPMPVSARRRLFDLSDDMATRINVLFYPDTPDALLKALLE